MKIKFSITLIVVLFFSYIFPALAQDEAVSTTSGGVAGQNSVAENPVAYFGTITDKTNDSIQIKSDTGEIEQIAISDITSFIKTGKGTTKIDFNELAIGDYIVSMGYARDNGLLDAGRILLFTSAPEQTKRKIIIGSVVEVGNNQVTVKSNNQTYYLKPATNVTVTTNSDGDIKSSRMSLIEKEGNILGIGEVNGSLMEARKIHILPTQN